MLSTTTSTSLLFVRHGVTEMNEYLSTHPYGVRGFVDPGYYDTRLSVRGVEQASTALRSRLAQEHARQPIELVICSPLSRALATADLGLHDIEVPCIVDADLAERRYLSSDVGRQPAALAKEFPRFAAALESLSNDWWWEASEAENKEAFTRRLALQGSADGTLEGVALSVEPEAAFVSRMERARERIAARAERVARAVIVSHWGVNFSLLNGRSLRNCEVVAAKPQEMAAAGRIRSPPS